MDRLHDLDTYSVAERLIRRMLQESEENTLVFLTEQVQNGQAWYWIAEYVRHLLWQHGKAGNWSDEQIEQWMDLCKVDTLQETCANRLNSQEITGRLTDFPMLNMYIWAWRDISGEKIVQKWVYDQSQNDEAFLNLLLQLRYHGTSSVEGHYHALRLSNMTEFLGEVEQIKSRISCIKETGHCAELVAQVEQSIERNRF